MPFALVLRVGPEDLDEMGHVHNVTYLHWITRVAVAHSTSVGLSPAAYHQRGLGFVVRRHEIDYLRPAMLADELVVETWVTAIGTARSERATIVRAKRGAILARARSEWVVVNIADGCPTRIPPDVRACFTVEQHTGRSEVMGR